MTVKSTGNPHNLVFVHIYNTKKFNMAAILKVEKNVVLFFAWQNMVTLSITRLHKDRITRHFEKNAFYMYGVYTNNIRLQLNSFFIRLNYQTIDVK